MNQKLAGLYQSYVNGLNALQSLFLLIVRLYWGWQFFLAGKGKLLNIDQTAGFFATLEIPMPKFNAILAGGTECFGGLLLLVGLGSRLITIPLAFTMVIAYLTADPDKVRMIFQKPDEFLTAAPFLFLYASLLILIFGPGKYSLDALLCKNKRES